MEYATMGIETRRNGNAYDYRKVRIGGRVVSQYVGSGERGRLFASLDQQDRADRLAAQAAQREGLEALKRSDREAAALALECADLAALLLLAAGYYQHKRQWRKRREQPMVSAETEERERARLRAYRDLPPLPAPDDYSREAFNAIIARSNRRDASAEDVTALRRFIKARGEWLSMPGGPLRNALEKELEAPYVTPLAREMYLLTLARRRGELGYDTASEIEKPLIDHLLLCELRLGHIEQSYTQLWEGSIDLNKARFWEGRLSAAQRRYLAAVETLARVRRVRVALARVLSPDGTRTDAVAIEKPGN